MKTKSDMAAIQKDFAMLLVLELEDHPHSRVVQIELVIREQ
jgi:hypothetical protein